jgi:hypothetical protein
MWPGNCGHEEGRHVDPLECFRRQLCQIPGVSLTLAGSLVKEFGSMAELYVALGPASPADRASRLATLPNIGKKTADKINRFLFI